MVNYNVGSGYRSVAGNIIYTVNHAAVLAYDNITVRIARTILPYHRYTTQPYLEGLVADSLVVLIVLHSHVNQVVVLITM